MLTLIRIINERASVLCPTEQQLAYAGELLAGPQLSRGCGSRPAVAGAASSGGELAVSSRCGSACGAASSAVARHSSKLSKFIYECMYKSAPARAGAGPHHHTQACERRGTWYGPYDAHVRAPELLQCMLGACSVLSRSSRQATATASTSSASAGWQGG